MKFPTRFGATSEGRRAFYPRMPRPARLPPPAIATQPIATAIRRAPEMHAMSTRPRHPPTLRASLSFLTTTSPTGDDRLAQPTQQSLEIVGYDRASRRIYALERAGEVVRHVIVIPTSGEGAGVPLAMAPDALDRLALRLEPMRCVDPRGYELTTRVIQRRGLRLAGVAAPIRKFALALGFRHQLAGVVISAGRLVVTAYLRPRVTLRQVWVVPGQPLAVAIVTYCGAPIGIGADKEAAVLATPALH